MSRQCRIGLLARPPRLWRQNAWGLCCTNTVPISGCAGQPPRPPRRARGLTLVLTFTSCARPDLSSNPAHCCARRHGEIGAIRDAATNLGNPHLRGCVLYTSSEPCPMCMGE